MKLQCNMHTGQTDSSRLTMKLIPDTGTNKTNVQRKKRLDAVTRCLKLKIENFPRTCYLGQRMAEKPLIFLGNFMDFP